MKTPQTEVGYVDNNNQNKVLTCSHTTAAYVALLDRIASTLENIFFELKGRK